MDWKSVAGPLIAAGAPTLGKILGDMIPIPGGAMLGEWAGKAVADALGVEPTPEAVARKIEADPVGAGIALAGVETEAQTKWKAQAEIAKAQAEVGVAQVAAVNETIRAENAAQASKPEGWWGQWRTLLAWTLGAETIAWPPFMMALVVMGRTGDLIQLSGLITTWWAARFGLLGVHVWTGSNERQAIVTGQAPSALGNVVKAITGKK